MLRGCLVWSGVIRWLVVFLLFALSVSLYLIVTSFLSPISLIAVCLPYLAYGLLLPPSVLVYLPPHSLHAVAVGWRGFLSLCEDVGVAVAEIFGEDWWVIGNPSGREEEDAWRSWPEILRAELLSSNLGRR